MTAPHVPIAIAVGLGLSLAAFVDLRDRRIPNQLVAWLAATGLVHALVAGGAREVPLALFGGIVGGALLFLPWRAGWLGGGDVKLLAAIGVWVGPADAIRVLLLGALIGGALAIFAFLRLGSEARRDVSANLSTIARGGALARFDRSVSRTIPFGVALAAAAIWVIGSSARGMA